jgi:hypothetical protein
MNEQRHSIKRQVIELTVPDPAQAQQLQSELSRIYHRRIVPLIEEHCSRISTPGRVQRIERLELDLGCLNLEKLEAELVAGVRAALGPALAAQVGEQVEDETRAVGSGTVAAQLELLLLFARSGSLPWWGDAGEPDLLDGALRIVLAHAPEQLNRLIGDLARSGVGLHRLAGALADASLARWIQRLGALNGSALAGDLAALVPLLRQVPAAAGCSRAGLRRSLWAAALASTAPSGRATGSTAVLRRAALAGLASDLNISYDDLIGQLRRVAPPSQVGLVAPAAVEPAAGGAEADEPGPADLAPPDSASASELAQAASSGEELERRLAALVQVLCELDGSGANLAAPAQEALVVVQQALDQWVAQTEPITNARREQSDRAAALKQAGANVPGAEVRWLAERIQVLRERDTSREDLATPAWKVLIAALDTLVRSLPSAQRRGRAESILDPDVGNRAAQETLQPVRTTPTLPHESEPDLAFSDADEVYIDNAGLVILWPFLSSLFTRLDLLAGPRFKHAAAQQRAVGLLQYIAAGLPAWPEYLLPLNKLLCGMELDALVDFGEALSETEVAECTDMLTALIAQTPILGAMTPDGLRGSFLLRQAVLGVRDGAWLLRVERQTYDLVLDRFPWGWAWVKLPWMQTPLRVEW